MEVFLSKDVLLSLFVLSVVTFVVSLIGIPFLLVRLPSHYFDERHPRNWMQDHHPVLRLIGLGLKNAVGVLLFLAGIAMIVLPGQGLLTILIGISLLDFPGKRHMERRLIGQPAVLKTINKLREKFGRPPLIVA
ncbi:MAG: PGPGW domain-containing protein [Nitrospiraceae bacterium]